MCHVLTIEWLIKNFEKKYLSIYNFFFKKKKTPIVIWLQMNNSQSILFHFRSYPDFISPTHSCSIDHLGIRRLRRIKVFNKFNIH
jgi:hypothetical protein